MSQESVLRITIDSREAKRNAEALNRELVSIERNGDFATKSMDSMSSSARQLAGYMAGIVTVGAAINKMDAYTGISNKLKLVTESQEELNQAMQDTFAIAQKSASSWGAVNDVYSKYMSNAKTLNLTQEQTARLTEITSKAVAISGSTTESAAGALFQYGQALDGNILRAEEYNSLVDGAGGLLNAMAKGLGVTRGELRQMMLDGKLTGEVITKALLKAGESVDELYNKTDVTIGQSLTVLSNEVTKFTGETGKASGAASILSSSIQVLASNFNDIAGIAMVGGVALLTKTILSQVVAIQGYIAKSLERRAAEQVVIQSQINLAALEVQRTRQVAALALTEVSLARQELNSAITRQERAAATMRLTQAEVALAIAQKQTTSATATQTAAENALNASRSRGAAILGLVGGPVGALTIGVTALAAGYMYFSNKAADANAKLEEQGKVANKTTQELLALDGAQKRAAKSDLEESFKAQNKELETLNSQFNAAVNDIRTYATQNNVAYESLDKIREISDKVRAGQISQADAIKEINKLYFVKPEQIKEVTNLNTKYDEQVVKTKKTSDALFVYGEKTTLAGNAAQNAATKVAGNTKELKNNETAARDASKAQKDYFDSLRNDVLTANERLAYMNLGYSKEVIDEINKLQEAKQKALGDGATAIVTTEEINKIAQAQKALDAVKDKEDEIAESKKKQNKEGEKKLKITQAELEVAKRSAALVESSGLGKYAESKGIPSSVIAGLLAQESGGIKGAKSDTGAIGYWQTTSAYRKQNNLSVADSYNLEKTGRVVIDNLAKVYEKTGNLAQAILSHNAGVAGAEQFIKTGKVSGSKIRNKEVSEYVGKVSRYSDIIAGGIGKGGLSDGDSDRAYEEQIRARLELVKQGLNLQDQYESEQAKRTKARNEEINLAQQTGQADLIPKIKERYAAQDEISRLQLDAELNSYRWTEDQKLQNTHDINIQRLTAEGQYSDKQKALVKQALDEQLAYELEAYKKLQEKKLIEFKVGLQNQTGELQRLAIEATAKNTMSSPRLATWQLQDDYSTSTGNAWDDYQNAQKEANTKGDNGQYVNDDKTRKEMLLEAERQYQSQLLAIKQKAAQDEAMLRQQQQAATLAGYGAMFGMVGSMLDAYGEKSSASYRIAFALQKAFVLSSALLNAKGAVMAAWNDPSNTTIWSKMAAAAATVIQTNDLMSAIQGVVLSGMAHDGIDNIPKEGTWLLDKGERVVDSRTNADLKGMIANQKNGGGDVHIQVTVTDSGVSTQSNQSDQKQLGQMIGNAVRAVIRREQRQGGLLSK
ncbi:tape measure protein [Acinetobacter sp. CS-2]|uniref:tape measure protein n=1 Tax=Acinetobacter sp. CS-2 TaxID=2798861 RepID=UPI001906C1CC|nr:tape measure protein [Acinetobacter sp. CS-2]QQN40341.1 tape measure protein [Acinetobacter sp. CS-2]